MTDWIAKLESHNPEEVEAAKQRFHDQFITVREAWVLNGLYEYYITSNSVRSMEILVSVPEPHHIHLFDKLTESIKGNRTDTKVQALTLLGHVLRKQPTWLYKIAEHQLLKEILKRLKTEIEILPLLSALFVLIVLLPIIPSLMGEYLPDVFEIFSRLASWNCDNSGKLGDDLMVHMQVALYALFQRLYGMYPCNFLGYLRNQYRDKNLMPIFTHTIKPLLDSVKMHPALVTASKDYETTTARWKTMGAHDVIVECERLSLDVSDRCPHDSCHFPAFRSRSGTTNSTTVETPFPYQNVKTAVSSEPAPTSDIFSPSSGIQPQTPPVIDMTGATAIPYSQLQNFISTSREGTSPPEAAIEATPETTPIKQDMRLTKPYQNPSTVPKALTFNARSRSINSATTTPTHSQPSSPMRKDPSPFVFPQENKRVSAFRSGGFTTQKVQRLMQDRSQVGEPSGTDGIPRSRVSNPPTSPLRIISLNENAMQGSMGQRIESPISQEDEEVVAIVHQGEFVRQPERECDSVLQEIGKGTDEDLDDCEHEHGSPCTAGGLHMPNSVSMHNFVSRVRRLRYHSQCGVPEMEQQKISTGSSPGNANLYPNNLPVRRANSCPEMKKTGTVANKDNVSRTLDETDEETNLDDSGESNGIDVENKQQTAKKTQITSETQTDNIWPMPYEHLFLGIFPSLENSDYKPSPAPSPAPFNVQQEKCYLTASVYDILDRHIDMAINTNERDERERRDAARLLKGQLNLLHQQLLFERHRRETHAFRNRRLLADARNTRALEEHNSALRDQVQLQQGVIDALRQELDILKKDQVARAKERVDNVRFCETQARSLQKDLETRIEANKNMQTELEIARNKCLMLDRRWQQVEATVEDAHSELKIAREQALVFERLKAELERVNKELLLAGELQVKYQERLSELSQMRKCDQELVLYKEACHHETKGLGQQLEAKSLALEACRTRISQLEQSLVQSDESISVLKKRVNEVKEDYDERLKAVESKYATQFAINQGLEEKILELWQKLEMNGYRETVSPSTSSCHEVHPTSPLSMSLGSSEGSVAFLPPDPKDTRSLLDLLDQAEAASPSTTNEYVNSINMNQPGPSGQHHHPTPSLRHD